MLTVTAHCAKMQGSYSWFLFARNLEIYPIKPVIKRFEFNCSSAPTHTLFKASPLFEGSSFLKIHCVQQLKQTNAKTDDRPRYWVIILMRDHPDETTLMSEHPHERPPWWVTTHMRDHPDGWPPAWETTLMIPSQWVTTLMKDHPDNTILMSDHLDERPPW